MSIGAALRRFARTSGTLDTTRAYLTMFDDIVATTLPSGLDYAYAGYVNGLWPIFPEVVKRFPVAAKKGLLLDITVFASGNATALDIENGDATIDQAPAWFERQVTQGVYRPVLYIQASNMKALEQEMASAHITRSAYRLWIAHYTDKAHLCSPDACGYGLSEADATQWTEKALGMSLDQSILLPDFFAARPAPKPAPTPAPAPAVPTWQETALNELPALTQGDVDVKGKPPFVRLMQSAIVAQGHEADLEAANDLKVDGDFGVHTTNALLAIQEHFGLHDSDEYNKRVCGPKTWAAVITGHP